MTGDPGAGVDVGDDADANADAVADGDGAAPSRWRKPKAWWLDRLTSFCWIGLAFLWALIAVWTFRLGESLLIVWVLTSLLSLLLLLAWPVVAVAVLLRRWPLLVAALATIAVQLVVIWPSLATAPTDPVRYHIQSINLFVDNAHLEHAARDIAAHVPQVLVIEEFTFAAQRAFKRTGLTRRFRYRYEEPTAGTEGEAVYSAWPLRHVPSGPAGPDVLAVDIVLPTGATLHLLGVHAFSPQPGDSGIWERTIHGIGRAMDHLDGPTMAIGDYNATLDQRVFRDLLQHGRRDAHRMTGRGLGSFTWPANRFIPPLVLIDHAVVSRELHPLQTSERTIAGSDHRMIDVGFGTL